MNQFIIDPVRVHSLTFSFSIQRCGVISAFNSATVQITNSVNVELWSRYPEYLIIIIYCSYFVFVLRVSCVQVTPIGVTTLYSTFSFFRRKKLLHQVGGTKVAQHGQTRYAHLMEILMWKKYHFQLYTRYGQLCRYYWWHIVCTILSLPAAGAGLRLASSLPDPVPGHSLSPSSGAEAAAASTPCLGRTPCLDSGK